MVKTMKKTTTIRLEEETIAELKINAIKEKISFNQLITNLIEEYLKDKEAVTLDEF